MKSVSLFYCEGNSDKVYYVQLEKSGNGYVINFQYGRRNSTLKSDTKTPVSISLAEAEKIYDKIVREKLGKGYNILNDEKKNEYSEVAPAQKKEVHILPQLLNPVENAQDYINDDNYLMQPKVDGERRMIIADGYKVIGLNKKGTEVPLPKSITDSIKISCALDGEIIANKLFLFDILSTDKNITKEFTCAERLKILVAFKHHLGDGVEVIKTAYTKEDKQKMYDDLKKNNAEGIVFKKKDSKYTAGRPASGGSQLKHKFYNTATFIVEGSTKGRRSVGLQLVDGDKRVFLGKCTIPPNQNVPEVGSLVEVRYLYAYRNGAVYQPTYLGERNDSDLTDATISQLVYKAEVEA